MGMDYKFNRAWAEVNLDNIAHNVKEIRRIVDKKVEIMGVVKADAYGHGVMEIARTLLENGVTRLAVSCWMKPYSFVKTVLRFRY